jgi:hypothetical protein
MAADLKTKYGTSNQALTITLASLAAAALRQSTAVDNTTNLFLNALVTAKVKTAAASVSATGAVYFYVFGTTDGGTTYTGGAGGTDAAFALEKLDLIPVGRGLVANVNATTYQTTFDVASAFGGVMPALWGVVVENQTGQAFDATAGNLAVIYQGVFAQSV